MTSEVIVREDQELDITELVNALAEQLDRADLPDKVIYATELLVSGLPTYLVARKVGVSAPTIRGWLSKYPAMALIVANNKQLVTKMRMAKLEQQFVDAVEKSQEILNLDLSGEHPDGGLVDSKILTVVAAQARYIIGLFAGQKSDVTVTHEAGQSLLKARKDALSYIAERINEQDVIETVVRVVDVEKDTEGPLYDEQGNPPFGRTGELDVSEIGAKCAICGNRYKALGKHLLTKHDMSAAEYEITYALEEGIVKAFDTNAKLVRRNLHGFDTEAD